MIPKVKTWKVTFTMNDGSVRSAEVYAPTKMLAKMVGNQALGYASFNSKKVTVSALRNQLS